GVEDGVEVERVDAERVEVVELVDDALEVAAVTPVEDAVLVEVLAARGLPAGAGVPVRSPRRHGPGPGHALDGELQRGARRVVTRVAVAEALGEELVEDGVGRPVGDGSREEQRTVNGFASSVDVYGLHLLRGVR